MPIHHPKPSCLPAQLTNFFYTVSNGFMIPINEPQHNQARLDYSSYLFNGGNLNTFNSSNVLKRWGIDISHYGIGGHSISTIQHPGKTILLTEAPAFVPYSWHQPKRPLSDNYHFNDAMNMVNFVDGHTSYIKIFWARGNTPGLVLGACFQNPPSGYDYQWSGD